MGQITTETIAMIRRAVDAGQAPPLTLWEFQQLAFLAEKQIATPPTASPVQAEAPSYTPNLGDLILALDLWKAAPTGDHSTHALNALQSVIDSLATRRPQEQRPVARVNNEGFIVETGDLPLAPGVQLYAGPVMPEVFKALAGTDPSQPWTPEQSRTYPQMAANVINAALGLYTATPPTASPVGEPHRVPDGVWEALQRMIEDGFNKGQGSQDDARTVARWRAQFVPAREGAALATQPQSLNEVRDNDFEAKTAPEAYLQESLALLAAQKPAAWICHQQGGINSLWWDRNQATDRNAGHKFTPLYTSPQPEQVVQDLTDDEINDIWCAKDNPQISSVLSPFGMDRIRAIIRAARTRGEKGGV